VGPLANDRQKNLMAPPGDNSVPEKGTSFRVGSWIFVTDGSGSFESYPIDQNPPEVAEATSHHEFDDFVDRLEEVGFSALDAETRIQPEFGATKAKTLSELEDDLERLLKDTKQTPMDERIPSSTHNHFAKPSLRKKKLKTGFEKTTRKKKLSGIFFFKHR